MSARRAVGFGGAAALAVGSLATGMVLQAPPSSAAQWNDYPEYYGGAHGCDNQGRYMVYEFKKKVNGGWVGYSKYRCTQIARGEHKGEWALEIYGLVKK